MTATEENPTLYVEYSLNGTDWVSLLSKVESFNIKDSGIYKVAQCELKLWNKAGYFTAPNPPYQNNSYLRVRADVRGVIDTMFYGKTQIVESESDGKKEHLTVTARGRLNPLLKDQKTYKYNDDVNNGVHQWNILEAMRNAFTYPDSGNNTNIGIEGSGLIATALMKENFDRKTLLDIIQSGCEYVGYCGWDNYTVGTPDLHLEPVGTTLTSPLIEIPAEPLERKYSYSIDDLYNRVLVWAAPNFYYPARDYFCEGGYAAGFWSGLGNTVVSDDSNIVYYGSKSIKGINNTDPLVYPCQIQLDYSTVLPNGIDCNAFMILNAHFGFYWKSDSVQAPKEYPSITLIDSNNKTITQSFFAINTEQWIAITIIIGTINANGSYVPATIHALPWTGQNIWIGDVDFNWIIKKVIIKGDRIQASGTYGSIYVDGLYFDGAVSVDPTLNTSLQVYDAVSETSYGTSILNIDAPELSDYMFITLYGTSILNVVKNPIIKLTVKHGAKTWARCGQTVHVTSMPCYGLTDWYGRIVDLEFDYKAETKMLHSTFTLTPRYQPITSKEWYKGTLAGLLTYRQW